MGCACAASPRLAAREHRPRIFLAIQQDLRCPPALPEALAYRGWGHVMLVNAAGTPLPEYAYMYAACGWEKEEYAGVDGDADSR